MKAARYHRIHDVRYEKVENPVCSTQDVLIKVSYAGIY